MSGLRWYDELLPSIKLRYQKADDSCYKPLVERPQPDRVHAETERLLRMPRKKVLRNKS